MKTTEILCGRNKEIEDTRKSSIMEVEPCESFVLSCIGIKTL